MAELAAELREVNESLADRDFLIQKAVRVLYHTKAAERNMAGSAQSA